jgi:hypothetical protein
MGNVVFDTAPIPTKAWLFVLPFTFAMLAFEETRKFLIRRLSSRFHLAIQSEPTVAGLCGHSTAHGSKKPLGSRVESPGAFFQLLLRCPANLIAQVKDGRVRDRVNDIKPFFTARENAGLNEVLEMA